jgi:hypothetical protein
MTWRRRRRNDVTEGWIYGTNGISYRLVYFAVAEALSFASAGASEKYQYRASLFLYTISIGFFFSSNIVYFYRI